MAGVNNSIFVGQCAHILLSPACQNIAFHWLGQFIGGKGYREVTLALLDSRIRLVTRPLPADTAGEYSYKKNRLILDSTFNPNNLSDQMTVVHEATHAIQDIEYDGTSLARWDVEAAGYVAEWSYFLNFNPSNKQWDHRSTDPIDVLALEIAGKIMFDEGPISSNLMNQLTDAIIADPVYQAVMLSDPFLLEDGIDPPDFP